MLDPTVKGDSTHLLYPGSRYRKGTHFSHFIRMRTPPLSSPTYKNAHNYDVVLVIFIAFMSLKPVIGDLTLRYKPYKPYFVFVRTAAFQGFSQNKCSSIALSLVQ